MSAWWGLVCAPFCGSASLNVIVKLQRAHRSHHYKGYWCIMQSDRWESLCLAAQLWILGWECLTYIHTNTVCTSLLHSASFSILLPSCLPRDRLRTTTNVLGDSLGAGIVEHLSRGELQNQDAEVRNSVIEENEKPYQLICQENDSLNHRNSETTMWGQERHPYGLHLPRAF